MEANLRKWHQQFGHIFLFLLLICLVKILLMGHIGKTQPLVLKQLFFKNTKKEENSLTTQLGSD